ncbi:MAG: hypothetical protein IPO94_11940 [Saprospiraceae bacterium]|nr:hypothetical protein [Saprospiraceae bacterium]
MYRLTVTDPNDDTNGADGPVCTTVTDITVTYTGPIITCPADFTAATDAGSCSTFMNLIPAEINAACADEFTIRYWVTGATTIASMAAPETLSTVNATAFNVGVNTVHAIVGTLSGGVFTPLAPEVSCTYTANVIDREPPIAKCKDISVFLNSAGQASVTAAMVNGGSTDNCGVTAAFICPTIQGFTGIFAPGNWNFNPGINGTLDTNNAPNSLTLSGSNSGPSSTPGLFQPPPGVLTTLCINVPASGSITFTWNYQSFDSYSSANWDRFGYSVNGVFTQLTLNDGPLVQSGTNTVTLNSGDVFCFVQGSDNVDGVGVTISNMFIFESTQLPCNFTCANLGQNDVTLIVRDAFGNSSTCLANVTVVDAIPPTLVCPANITMNVSSNTVCTWTSGSLAPTTYTDNCTVPPVLTYSILNPDQTVANGTGAVNAYVFAKVHQWLLIHLLMQVVIFQFAPSQ